MKYIFNKGDFEKFKDNLNKIISYIDKCLAEGEEESNILLVLNKLHIYSQDFFVSNEMRNKFDSDALTFFKDKRTSFINELKSHQKKITDCEKDSLLQLKKYLNNWLEEHEVYENV